MNKTLLIKKIISLLSDTGFIVSDRCDIRPRSFDMAARKDERLLLIKVLYNIDGFNLKTATEMRVLSEHLKGFPMIIGEKSRDHSLESGVVYYRYNIPAFNIETMNDYLIENNPPLIYAEHGGLYVKIEGTTLRKHRIKKGISIGDLASMLGVSRRTISKYEEGEMAASVDIAIKLEEILDTGLATAVDIFKSQSEVIKTEQEKSEIEPKFYGVFSILENIGFNVLPITQAPFDALSLTKNEKYDTVFLVGIGKYTSSILKKAHLMSSISEVTLTRSIFVVHGESKRKNIDKTIVIDENELKNLDDFEEFLNILSYRQHKNSYESELQ